MPFLPMLFLFLSAFAQDEMAVEKYCFPTESARLRAQKELTSISVPSDDIQGEKECLTVKMRPHRRELLQNYMSRIDPDMFVAFSSAEIRRDPCQLQVEKIRTLKNQQTGVIASPILNAQSTKVSGDSKDVMQIQTLDKFSFTVSQDVIEGSCRFISRDLYEISITARRDPKPVVPPNLPPNTIVVIQTPPEDQKTLSVSTSLQLRRGDRIEIGSVVKDLRKKEHGVDIKPLAQASDTNQKEEEKVFLSFQ